MARGEGTDREFLYEYSLKDHLGNSRVTFMGTDLGGAVDIVQTTNYYPFGLVMSQTNETHSQDYRKNMYLYNEGFSALNIAAMYNGNISGMKWKNGSAASVQKGYGFTYDQVNRLTTSKYGEGSYFTTYLNRYCENMTYDKNGNILKLLRSGQTSTGVFGRLDSLTYKYTNMGNQVRAISDSVPDITGRGDFFDGTNGNNSKEYYYDKNGNMWLDRNKRMKIVYNYLNLPAQVIDTVTPANKIEYVYTAAGEKLKQRLSTGTTLLYLGNFVYKLDGTANGIAVNYILTQEGRATNSAGTYTYEYFMKDHLGNTRVSFNVPSTTAIIVQQNDYYPFGMIHQPQATATSDNRYLYNGKELQNNLLGGVNLDWYDYGARFYDPQIGRWNTFDPHAENYFGWTLYNYVADNPIKLVDPDGRDWDISQLTKKQQMIYKKEMNFTSNRSSLYNVMFKQLSKSKTTYHVNIGTTYENAPAQFNASTNTLTFRSENEILNSDAYIEEVFHAYQKDNIDLYEKGKEFNKEFEAKISKTIIEYEAGYLTYSIGGTEGLISFMENKYGLFGVPSKSQINSSEFLIEYKKQSEVYKNFNIQNNIGNENYRKRTLQTPKSLLNLFK